MAQVSIIPEHEAVILYHSWWWKKWMPLDDSCAVNSYPSLFSQVENPMRADSGGLFKLGRERGGAILCEQA